MKRVLFLLLVSVFMLPAFHSEAQVQGTQTSKLRVKPCVPAC